MTENIPVPTVRELLSFRPLPCLGVTAQVMILVGLYLLSIATFYWSVRVTGTLGWYSTAHAYILFAPIYEEALFRGVIFGSLLGSWRWFLRALVFTNILFGLWHAKNILFDSPEKVLEQIAYAGLVIGPIMGYVAYRARSIYPSVMIHTANNILAVACFTILAPK